MAKPTSVTPCVGILILLLPGAVFGQHRVGSANVGRLGGQARNSPALASAKTSPITTRISITSLPSSGNCSLTPEIGHAALCVSKSGADLLFTWSGGGPFTLTSAADAKFLANTQTLVEQTSSTTFPYGGSNGTEFYDVADVAYDEPPAPARTKGFTEHKRPIVDNILPQQRVYVGDQFVVTGQNFDPLTMNNQVFWGSIPASIVDDGLNTSSRLKIQVPPGAVTGAIYVCSFGYCSLDPTDKYWHAVVLVIDPGTHTDISALAFDEGRTPGTADHTLRMADRNFAQIYSIDPETRTGGASGPTALVTGTSPARPLMSTATAADGSVVFVSENGGSESDQIWSIGRTSAAATPFATTRNNDNQSHCGGVRAKNAVAPRGLAFFEGSPSKAYLCDNTTGYVREVNQNTLLTSGSGIAPTFSGHHFNAFYDPCPLDAVPVPSSAVRIVPAFDNQTNTWYDLNTGDCPSDTAVFHGMRSPNLTSFTHDEVSKTIWFTRAPGKSLAFAQEKTTHYGFLAVAQPDPSITTSTQGINREADPEIAFEPWLPTRVLISTRAGGGYFDPHQFVDGQIAIDVYYTLPAVDPNSGLANTLYFRLVDPKDGAPYAASPACTSTGGCVCQQPVGNAIAAQSCDNHSNADSSDRAFIGLVGPAGGTPSWNINFQPDNSGHSVITLYITHQYAGDSYQIQASYQDFTTSTNAHIKALSPVFTAWKRVYVERDSMFRRGGVLARDYNPGTCGTACSELLLYNVSNCPFLSCFPQFGEKIVVIDDAHQYQSGGEEVKVTAVPEDMGDGTVRLQIEHPLKNTYLKPGISGDTIDFTTGTAGVGVTSGCDQTHYYQAVGGLAPCLYWADTSEVHDVFNDAYVDVVMTGTGSSALPYITFSSSASNTYDQLRALQARWFSQYGNPPTAPQYNYIWLLGAERNPGDSNERGVTLFTGGKAARASVTWAVYFVAKDRNMFTTDHELGHNFQHQNIGTDWHCSNPAYTPPSDGAACLMQSTIPANTGTRHRFCKWHLIVGGTGGNPIGGDSVPLRDQPDPIPSIP